MTATITSKGQITIPISLRQKFHLNVGDKLEFDENAPVLTARRAVNRDEWESALADFKNSTVSSLLGHPWADQSSAAIIDDLRGGPIQGNPRQS